MDNRPASEYAQPGSHHPNAVTDAPSEQKPAEQTSAAAAHYTPQPEARPTPQYTPQPEVRPANISSANTPQSDYGLNPPPTARSPGYQDYLHRPPQSYAPNSQPGGAPGMAQATNPSLPANSPTYPPPYSPYQPQGHEMAQYQGHPPPPQHMYARPDWPHSYGQQHHGLPGPYASPATTVGSTSPVGVLKGPRSPKVYSFVPIPGAQQHKRPRRRYEEIERMYKCGWNGCEKAYGTLNHLNAHVTMQSHGAKRTPEGVAGPAVAWPTAWRLSLPLIPFRPGTSQHRPRYFPFWKLIIIKLTADFALLEFKEIRKEWKARKKEEDAQRKAIEERERAAVQAAQANQVEPPNPSDPSHGQPPPYAGGVRPQLPPIGYQPADSQVPGQYGGPPGSGMVYQSNAQIAYPPNYPHSPYQSGPGYPQRE
ncbi:hypothetical protein DTO006G1_7723 [Penicillium roqueforti]|nr:hypothetical protein CBS147337_4990 [Penicillium roqueforti]KAI2674817.1 hypothetical protein CBS147355_6631 [Penicillium roqueforti]KAI2687976.1 hypothetical protein LCP963914a_3494 [Penicillium roqueforti]KAI2699915.1 hypothetical protein CBS147372_6225 [Penicillium roqueforti]KAI2710165.1 hypothetical protein CBS147332_5866 [Penicillium roqueforti]